MDIAINQVASFDLRESELPVESPGYHESQRLALDNKVTQMVLKLKSDTPQNYLFNAKEESTNEVIFTFGCLEVARKAVATLKTHGAAANNTKAGKRMRSAAINVSNNIGKTETTIAQPQTGPTQGAASQSTDMAEKMTSTTNEAGAERIDSDKPASQPDALPVEQQPLENLHDHELRTGWKSQTIGHLANINDALSPEPAEPSKKASKASTPRTAAVKPKQNMIVDTADSNAQQIRRGEVMKEDVEKKSKQRDQKQSSTVKKAKSFRRTHKGKGNIVASGFPVTNLAKVRKSPRQLKDHSDVYDFPPSEDDEEDNKRNVKPTASKKQPVTKIPVKKAARPMRKSKSPRSCRKTIDDKDWEGDNITTQSVDKLSISGQRRTRVQTRSSAAKQPIILCAGDFAVDTDDIKEKVGSEGPVEVEEIEEAEGATDISSNSKAFILKRADHPEQSAVNEELAQGRMTQHSEVISDFEDLPTHYSLDDLKDGTVIPIHKESNIEASRLTDGLFTELGTSQSNAIDIPSSPESDSEISSKAKTPAEDPRKYDHSIRASSPPKSAPVVSPSTPRPQIPNKVQTQKQSVIPALLIDEVSARKPSFIEFGPLGPRNQGFLSNARQLPVTPQGTNKRAYPEVELSPMHQERSQPKQHWIENAQVRNESMDDNNATKKTPVVSSAKRRKLLKPDKDDDDNGFVHIDDILGAQLLHPVYPTLNLEAGISNCIHDPPENFEPRQNKKIVEILRNPVEITREKAAEKTSSRRKSSNVSQRSVHISTRGSPIPIDEPFSEIGTSPPADNTEDMTFMDANEVSDLPWLEGDYPVFSADIARIGTHVMSSNSKPIPQHPDADSRAISGYVPERVVQEAVVLNQHREVVDPFVNEQESLERKSAFMLKLSEIAAEMAKARLAEQSKLDDADKTFVEDEDMADATIQPEAHGSGPSVEEMEWEGSLEPRHRSILEVLGRIARRLVSHIIDSETAVQDIIEDYVRDGTYLIEKLESAHREQCDKILVSIHGSRQKLGKEYAQSAKWLNKQCVSLGHATKVGLNDWKTSRQMEVLQLQKLEAL